jgi:hypothetical protein
LSLLQQNPPQLEKKTQSALLDWAVENWHAEKLFKQHLIPYCVETP